MEKPSLDKGQSVVEYLITYGWTIMVIMIIIVAVYQLGAFNFNANSAQRVVAGQCGITRPLGPGTLTDIGLVGLCNGNLPNNVVSLEKAAGSSIIVTSLFPSYYNKGFTITAWIEYSSNDTGCGNEIFTIVNRSNASQFIDLRGTCGNGLLPNLVISGSKTFGLNATTVPMAHKWYFIAATWSPNQTVNNAVIYINGKIAGAGEGPTSIPEYGSSLAFIGGFTSIFNGSIANVQLYNYSLTQSQIQTIYIGGIGGAVRNLTTITGWWPLNGDTNDYSGNNNNARSTSIIFNNGWASSYSAPG